MINFHKETLITTKKEIARSILQSSTSKKSLFLLSWRLKRTNVKPLLMNILTYTVIVIVHTIKVTPNKNKKNNRRSRNKMKNKIVNKKLLVWLFFLKRNVNIEIIYINLYFVLRFIKSIYVIFFRVLRRLEHGQQYNKWIL